MGRMEFEMRHAKFPPTTRYATYRTGPPEGGVKHLDCEAILQLFVREMEKAGMLMPETIKVTLEWVDQNYPV